MKFISVILCLLIAAVIFFFIQSDRSENLQSDDSRNESVMLSDWSKFTYAAPENSLAKRLILLEEKEVFVPLRTYDFKAPFNFAKAEELLSQNPSLVREVHKLARFDTAGIRSVNDLRQNVNYINAFRNVGMLLAISIEYNAAANKQNLAENDVKTGAKILSTYLTGSSSLLHFMLGCAVRSMLQTAISKSQMSAENKTACLAMLPDRKQFAANLNMCLNDEKNTWLKTQKLLLSGDIEIRKIIEENDMQYLASIPAERFEKLLTTYIENIYSNFSAGTLNANINANGTAEENTFISKIIPLNGIISAAKTF